MSLDEFEQKFAINSKRLFLFNRLYEELHFLKKHSESLLVLVYGSYITEKENPNDIDILVHVILNQKGIDLKIKGRHFSFPCLHPSDIQVKGKFTIPFMPIALDSVERLITNFNEDEKNNESLIRISNFIELDI